MDAEILHARLSAAESALIKIDERLDALTSTERLDAQDAAQAAQSERLAALEEMVAECRAQLQNLSEISSLDGEARIAEARAVEAISEALEDQAEAEIAEAEAVSDLLTMEEPFPTEPIEEIPAEPASAVAPEKPRSNWLENLLALR
jgi:chromosome segregation ATPase